MSSPAASRTVLDRRIAEEGLIALNPPFERPEWYYELTAFPFMPIAFVMGEDGTLLGRAGVVDLSIILRALDQAIRPVTSGSPEQGA